MIKHSAFHEECYKLLDQIPKGKVTTYSEIAKALGSKAYRAVGTAMAKNDKLIIRPCHRVVRHDGCIGQYALGADKKQTLLLEEGVDVVNGKIKDLNKFMFKFS